MFQSASLMYSFFQHHFKRFYVFGVELDSTFNGIGIFKTPSENIIQESLLVINHHIYSELLRFYTILVLIICVIYLYLSSSAFQQSLLLIFILKLRMLLFKQIVFATEEITIRVSLRDLVSIIFILPIDCLKDESIFLCGLKSQYYPKYVIELEGDCREINQRAGLHKQ